MERAERQEEAELDAAARHCDEGVLGLQALAGKSPLEELMAAEEGGGEAEAVRVETMRRLMGFLFVDDCPENPIHVTRRVYALAKAFYPHLIQGMSLHQLGVIFEEQNEKSGRARWSAIVKRVVNAPVEAAGGKASGKFQKGRKETYQAAQKGNQNRRKKT